MPTAERPESGTIGSAGIPLFRVEHWLEGGDHVFRSTEFDMTIGAPDIGAAADRFIESAYDLWGFMEEQQNLTEGELQLASLLASRFRLLLAEFERRARAPAAIDCYIHSAPGASRDVAGSRPDTWQLLASIARITGDPGKPVRHGQIFRVEVVSKDGERCGVPIQVDDHPGEPRPYVLNQIADTLRIERGKLAARSA